MRFLIGFVMFLMLTTTLYVYQEGTQSVRLPVRSHSSNISLSINKSESQISQLPPTSSGVDLMLINKLAGGYVKEYLELCRDLSNTPVTDSVSNSGAPLQLDTLGLLGLCIAEQGLGDNFIPYSAMEPTQWGTTTHSYLKIFNYSHISDTPEDYLNKAGYNPNNTYLGPFQIHKSYATWSNPSPYSNASYADWYFLPDQIYWAVQNSVESLKDFDTLLSDRAIPLTAAAAHNGGAGILINTFLYGDAPGKDFQDTLKFSKYNGLKASNVATCYKDAADLLNSLAVHIDEIYAKYSTEFKQIFLDYPYQLYNHPFWRGVAMGDLIFNQGYLPSDFSKDILINYSMNDLSFLKGMSVISGIPENDLVSQIQNITCFREPSRTIYGYIYQGKNNTKRPSSLAWDNGLNSAPNRDSLYDACVYCYTDYSFIGLDGQQHNSISCFNLETAGYMYTVQIASKFVYYKLLQYGGVE